MTTDWASESAAQMMARNTQLRGARTLVVDGWALEEEIATALRIAKRMGELDNAISTSCDLREVVRGI